MGWTLTGYSVAAFAAAGLSAVLGVLAARTRREPYTRTFVVMMGALALWAGAYGVQWGFADATRQITWFRVGIAVGAVVPTLWFLYALQYAGEGDRLDRRWLAVSAVEPTVVALLAVTDGRHELLFGAPRIAPLGESLPVFGSAATLVAGGTDTPPSVVVDVTLGPAFFVHAAYSYVLVGIGVLLVGRLIRSQSSLLTTQASLLAAGAVPPLVANLSYTLGVSPVANLDTTPLAFTLTSTVWALALFQFDLLDRAPAAQRRAMRDVGDGLIVTDERGTVVEVNEIVRRALDPPPTVGESIDPYLPSEDADVTALDGTLASAVIENRRRVYDLRVTALDDERGRTAGHAVIARDVTERHASRERLEVANRVLRHNLSNDMNLIVGHARRIESTAVDEAAVEAARTIRTTGTELVDVSEKAREMVSFAEYHEDPVAIALGPPTERVVGEFRESHPDATVSVTVPAGVRAVVGSEAAYETALANLVENAVEHNDRAEPTVAVVADVDDDTVRVCVRDDGPGIPEMERRTLEDGSERPLRHGSGLGLWLAHWTVTAVGGSLDVSEREPRGSEVALCLPLGDHPGDETDTEATSVAAGDDDHGRVDDRERADDAERVDGESATSAAATTDADGLDEDASPDTATD
ncbi:histidine kinase N-terminal 7TM domain-containing protein [Halobaculum sp. MBLA0147]|uniref:histidine kinase N-terminal 7TM domain-containing protein n=1 Tax=Halobaculum sp. MBLA0147 TaxID=3079934 RepID=UPI003523EC5F